MARKKPRPRDEVSQVSTEAVVQELRSLLSETAHWQEKVAEKAGVTLPDLKGAEADERHRV